MNRSQMCFKVEISRSGYETSRLPPRWLRAYLRKFSVEEQAIVNEARFPKRWLGGPNIEAGWWRMQSQHGSCFRSSNLLVQRIASCNFTELATRQNSRHNWDHDAVVPPPVDYLNLDSHHSPSPTPAPPSSSPHYPSTTLYPPHSPPYPPPSSSAPSSPSPPSL